MVPNRLLQCPSLIAFRFICGIDCGTGMQIAVSYHRRPEMQAGDRELMNITDGSALHNISNILSNLRSMIPLGVMGIRRAIAQPLSVPATDLLIGLSFALSAPNAVPGIPIASPPKGSMPACCALREGLGDCYKPKQPSI